MKKFGIDVSLWQKGFDFEKAKAEGVEFVIIKCSQEDYTDPQFENHYKAAKAVGLGVGAYHYFRANTVADATKEAESCIKAIKGKQFEYPIYLDFEEGIYTKNSKEKNGELIKAFCKAVENAGYWVGVYTNYNIYSNHIDGAAIANRYTMWMASWTKEIPVDSPMWQFGGERNLIRTNKVAGVVCDQNYCFVDFPAKIKAAGLNGFAAEKKAETAKPEKAETKKEEADKAATKETVYTVKKGDTLSAIATKYGTDYMTLANYNGIDDPNVIHAGQKIRIPAAGTKKPVKVESIKKGDKVKVVKNLIYGTSQTFAVYFDKYDVLSVDGKRVVIGIGKVATAAVSADNLKKA